MSSEYESALEKARKASQAFAVAQKAYRAREIDDAEFLAARKLYDASVVEFDKAYEKESAR